MEKERDKESKAEQSLDERLREYPQLRARIEGLVDIVENADGEIVKADDAEERVIQEIRKIGLGAMQGWAERKHRRVVGEFDKRARMSRKEKKTSTGTRG